MTGKLNAFLMGAGARRYRTDRISRRRSLLYDLPHAWRTYQ